MLKVDTNIWVAKQNLKYWGLEVGTRMTVIRLENGELVSPRSKLAYPVRGGIPIMLASEGREMMEDELVKYLK